MSQDKPFIIHVEDDTRLTQMVEEGLKKVSPTAIFKAFPNFAEFEKWLDVPATERLPDEEPRKLDLMILPADHLREAADVGQWFRRVQTAGAAPELKIILTSFEGTDHPISKWIPSGAHGLWLKPFDPLLVQQHLKITLGLESNSEAPIFEMKTDAIIEALKPAMMISVSEVGFLTRSDRDLPLGRVTKFYGKIFLSGNVHSVSARTQACDREDGAKDWHVRMLWFGVGRDQLLQIRGRFPKSRQLPFSWITPPKSTLDVAKILVVGDPSPAGSELTGTLTRTFPGANVQTFLDIPGPNVTLPSPLTAVIIHRDFLDRAEKDPRFAGVPLIVVTERPLKDDDFRKTSTRAVDIVTLPVERMSLMKKWAVMFPALTLGSENQIQTFDWTETVEVGQAVTILQISEASLIERYERPLPVGTFRRFVLWQPHEVGMPVLTARCYANQPDPSVAGAFINQFEFFGMTDHEIRHIRLWIRDNYIRSKEKG